MKINWADFIFGGVSLAILIVALYLCLSPGGGGTHGVASGGAAGDAACFVAIDSTHFF